MNREMADELHGLIVEFTGICHQKFFRVWHKEDGYAHLVKKNQRKVIAILFHEGTQTATELSEKLDLEKGGLTTLLDSLEHAGLVMREPNPKDRRQVLVSLTAEGRKHMERMIEAHRAILMDIFLGCEEKEVEALIRGLKDVLAIVRRL